MQFLEFGICGCQEVVFHKLKAEQCGAELTDALGTRRDEMSPASAKRGRITTSERVFAAQVLGERRITPKSLIGLDGCCLIVDRVF